MATATAPALRQASDTPRQWDYPKLETANVAVPTSGPNMGALLGLRNNGMLGARRTGSDGRIYVFGQAGDACVLGNAMKIDTAVATDTLNANAAAAATTVQLVTASPTLNQYAGMYLVVEGTGAKNGNFYRILGNSSGGTPTLTLDRGLDNALTAADAVRIICPWRFVKTAAVATQTQDYVHAVAIGTITDENYGWFQIAGFTAVLVDLTTNGTVRIDSATVKAALVTSGTAGVLAAGLATTTTSTGNEALAIAHTRCLAMATLPNEANTRLCPAMLLSAGSSD